MKNKYETPEIEIVKFSLLSRVLLDESSLEVDSQTATFGKRSGWTDGSDG